ncbi:MAG: hypothetical protein AAF677_18025 [Pseudomonadota bacterium]
MPRLTHSLARLAPVMAPIWAPVLALVLAPVLALALALSPASAMAELPIPIEVTPEARALILEGDALAAKARALDAMIERLQAEQDRLLTQAESRRGEGTNTGDGGTRSQGDQASGVVIGDLENADLARIAGLQDQIDAMTMQRIGYTQGARATWERAAAIDAGAANAVLRRIIETSN